MITDAIIDEGLKLDGERTPGEAEYLTSKLSSTLTLYGLNIKDYGIIAMLMMTTDLDEANPAQADKNGPFLAHAINHYADALREIKRLKKSILQSVEDECDDDTAIRELAKPFVDVEGDSYGVPGIVDIVESLVKLIPNSKEPTDA